MSQDGIEALNQLKAKLSSSIVNNDILLQDHRLDQRKDFPKISIKVVFSEKATIKFMEFVKKTIDTDYREYGLYFFGNKYDGFIYIDDFGSEFELANGLYANGAVNVTKKHLQELDQKTEKKYTDNPCNVVMHFHTHPDTVKDRAGNDYKPAGQLMSEQDLYSYGYHQLYLQPRSKNPVLYIGGMLAKNNNKPQFNIVFYDPERNNYYNMGNIFLTYDKKLIRLNNDNILSPVVKPNGISGDVEKRILALINN